VAGIGVEFIFVHLLSQLFNNTIYTFANLLAVYLWGTAAGAWLSRRYCRSLTLARIFWWLAIALVYSTVLLWRARAIYEFLRPPGAGLALNLWAEVTLSALVFLPSTVLMGILFSRLVGELPAAVIGRGYGWNTLGAALSPLLLGLVALRLGGSIAVLGSVVFLYLAGWYCLQPTWEVKPIFAASIVLGFQIWAVGQIDLISLPEGWIALRELDTLYGKVLVSEQIGAVGIWGQPLRRLQVNGNFWMGGGQGFAEMRLGHIALLLQPQARTLLYLGASTGVSLGAARGYPFKRIDAVEIVPQIVEEMHWFRALNFDVQHDARVRMIQADARRFVAGSPDQYDLIIADLFHPGLDGAGSLYTLEHYQNVSAHLNEDGLAVQAVPLYQFDTPVLQSLVRTFLEVFPEAHAFLAIYNADTPILLLAGKKRGHPLRIDLDWVREFIGHRHLGARVIEGIPDFLAAYMCDPNGLATFAVPGKMNSDLTPFILFHAPRQNYLQQPEARCKSLESLMPYASPPDFSLLRFAPGAPAREEYLSYCRTWHAAQQFMKAKIALVCEPAGEMTPRIVGLLEDAYLADPDFAPARGDLLRVAQESSYYRPEILSRLNARDKSRILQDVSP